MHDKKLNHITVRANGPLIARGQIRVFASNGELICEDSEVFLCRCGASANKPFCDGAHKQSGFTDAAVFEDRKAVPIDTDAAPGLDIHCRKNAMLVAKGAMLIQAEEGDSQTTRNKAAFCRCGASGTRPFCDASHKSCNFNSL